MRIHKAIATLIVALAALSPVPLAWQFLAHAGQVQEGKAKAVPKKGAVDEKAIRALIAQLGDDAFDKRETAGKRLADIGEPARQQLEKAAKEDQDPEVRERARLIIRAIEGTLFFQVRLFEGHQRQGPGPGVWITRLAITPDGRQLLTAGPDGLRLWDISTGKLVRFFGEHPAGSTAEWSLAISADGRRAITGSNGNNLVRVWDLGTGKLVQTLKGHTDEVWGVALFPDGRRAVSASWDKTIRIWDVPTGRELRSFSAGDKIRCLALSADGKRLAAGHFFDHFQPGTLRVWDPDRGQELQAFPGHTQSIASVVFSPDQKSVLTTGFDKTVRLWDLASGKEQRCFKGHQGRACWAAFTPDGRRIVSCASDADPTVRLWDVKSGEQIRCSDPCKDGILCLAVLPDGRRCITCGQDCSVRLWQWK